MVPRPRLHSHLQHPVLHYLHCHLLSSTIPFQVVVVEHQVDQVVRLVHQMQVDLEDSSYEHQVVLADQVAHLDPQTLVDFEGSCMQLQVALLYRE